MRASIYPRQSLSCMAVVLVMGSLMADLHAQQPRESSPRHTPSRRANGETAAEPLDMFEQQRLWKQFSDLSLFTQLGPDMIVRKIRYAGADGMTIPAYFFAPRDTTVKRPAIIMVHGGVHGDFTASHVTDVRSLVARGYLIVAPEYRGSTGYGREHYDAIDYGGKEVEDCIAARDYLAALVPNADMRRVGIMGWSHGGFISIHAVLRRPELFRVAVAHVPVADLPARIRTHSEAYHQIFAAQKGFGGRLEENRQAYIERSPIAHARKLTVPLLVHAADNDDDVFIIENRALRDSMVAAGMDKRGLYTYREWHEPPGGHSFSRYDTPQARESWRETVEFLDRHLGNRQ
ncbi:MAG: alpha/beta hydrolase family protein [Gemmatimonadaceae bacterium]